MGNGVSIFLNIVTRRQSMCKARSLSNVPTAKIFVEKATLFVVEGTDSN